MRVLIAALLLLASVTPAAAADPVIEPVGETSWYLAIGDSLAAGYQPIGDPANDHMTRAGYPDQLWLMARGQYPDLQLLNLACPGEDTASIRLDNGRCAYPHGSQLDEALAFIDEHRHRLAFITIDIGFNDFECSDDLLCVFTGIRNIEQRLPAILADLRAAAPDTPIVGMNIYDPFLTFWFDEQTRVLAGQSVVAMQMVNEALGEVYAAAGIPVADVETAFAMDDWRSLVPMAGFGEVPRNLALLCERTWQCHPPPLGPDRHPNVLGFRVMAEAFARELGLEPVGIDAGSSPVG
ncbi:MAG: SGNH/GDSL hydrolase family protein [Candidatus Limnocylindrales bacterium]